MTKNRIQLLRLSDLEIASMSNLERKKHIQKLALIKQLLHSSPSTIQDLVNTSNISQPTCQQHLNELLAIDLIEKKGKGVSLGGRRPDLYRLKDNAYYILSVNMERFQIKAAVYDNNYNLHGRQTLNLAISKDLSILKNIKDLVDNVVNESGVDQNAIIGIGISTPGLVDSKEKINYTYLSEGEGTLKEGLDRLFPYPTFVENDVKSATIAELRFGLAKNHQNALVVLLDWGIGLGIIMDGELRKGALGFSGEIGHMPFVDEGALCYCGKRGCLETVASGIALARMTRDGIKSGQHSLLNKLSSHETNQIEPHAVIDAANQGDQYAINMLSILGNNLGKGIATLIQLFNPDVIILGGKIAEAKQYITIPIIQSINTYSMTKIRENTSVILSELKQDGSLLGNVNIVIENLIDEIIAKLQKSP